MAIRLYSDYLRGILKGNATADRLPIEESARLLERKVHEHFEDRDTLIRWYLESDENNVEALCLVYRFMLAHRYRHIVSLGAGPCVIEHLLSRWLSDESRIVAAEYNPYYIEKAKAFFPSIHVEPFDFFRDDVSTLKRHFTHNCDLAVFFASAYTMDDDTFVKQFSKLKELGVNAVIDFHAGFMSWRSLPVLMLSALQWRVARTFKMRRFTEGWFFHGYARTKGELRRLYREAGLVVAQELSLRHQYRYVAVLRPSEPA